MTKTCETPPGKAGLADFDCVTAIGPRDSATARPAQAQKRPATRLRLVSAAPPPPRVEVRIIAYERHVPRARSFQLTHRDLDWLVAEAVRLERGRA